MIKLKTEVLRDMLNKAVKVCSFNKMLPLTGLVEMETNAEGLFLKTTDGITTMVIKEKIEGLEPARVTVDANIITTLVNKITTEDSELLISNNALTITGNGVYNLEIRVDESGEIVKLPAINQELANSATKEFDFKGIVERLNICKSAIAAGEDGKELRNYYLKDMIIATDQVKVSAVSNIPSMVNEELFIGVDLGRIIMDLGFIKANYARSNENLVIVGENFVLSSTMQLDDLGNYGKTLQGVQGLINSVYANKVTVKKNDLISLLDRLGIFVSEYDSSSIDLLFLPEYIKVTNQKETCDEIIKYEKADVNGLVEFPSVLNIEHLRQLLAVLPDETIEFQFDSSMPTVKIVDGDIVQFLGIMDENQ